MSERATVAVSAVRSALRIGQLAAATGLKPRTLRFYETIGLLTPAARTASGYRLYTPAAVQRLQLVRRARDLGLPLSDVRDILRASDAGLMPCEHVLAAVDRQLAATGLQLRRLRQMRSELSALKARVSGVLDASIGDPGQPCPCFAGDGEVIAKVLG